MAAIAITPPTTPPTIPPIGNVVLLEEVVEVEGVEDGPNVARGRLDVVKLVVGMGVSSISEGLSSGITKDGLVVTGEVEEAKVSAVGSTNTLRVRVDLQ
jgi:hypothetical protein